MDTHKKNNTLWQWSSWRLFTVNIVIIILLFSLGVFIGLFFRTKSLFREQILKTARAHFANIVLTRKWNAEYGGVFVEKKEGVISNPYLENPDIKSVSGKTYTNKNPALMTREISEYAEKEGLFKFHITSLKPVNPANKPDSFEENSLHSFEKGLTEVYDDETRGQSIYFRYMAPLLVQKSCLPCHAKQGYRTGDIRGGISVSFDITEEKKIIRNNRLMIIGFFVISTILIIVLIVFLIRRLSRKLSDAYEQIRFLSVTDQLTQLSNRHAFIRKLTDEAERAQRYKHSLCLVMFDIDHFKNVNDTYGHQAGDKVLQTVSFILRNNCRTTDMVARYGGEEIAVIMPETVLKDAAAVAEKLRHLTEINKIIVKEGVAISVTVSGGVAESNSSNNLTYEELIRNSDKALYAAKTRGRNRIEINN